MVLFDRQRWGFDYDYVLRGRARFGLGLNLDMKNDKKIYSCRLPFVVFGRCGVTWERQHEYQNNTKDRIHKKIGWTKKKVTRSESQRPKVTRPEPSR